MKIEIEVGERRFATAHLGLGNIVVPGMFPFARMLVLKRVVVVHMRFVAVAVQHLRVEVHASWAADIAGGVHMHVQAAYLHRQEAHAKGDRHRKSHKAHGENCITAASECPPETPCDLGATLPR